MLGPARAAQNGPAEMDGVLQGWPGLLALQPGPQASLLGRLLATRSQQAAGKQGRSFFQDKA